MDHGLWKFHWNNIFCKHSWYLSVFMLCSSSDRVWSLKFENLSSICWEAFVPFHLLHIFFSFQNYHLLILSQTKTFWSVCNNFLNWNVFTSLEIIFFNNHSISENLMIIFFSELYNYIKLAQNCIINKFMKRT